MKHFMSLSAKTLIMLAFICTMGFSTVLAADHQSGDETTKPSAKPEGSPKIQFDELSHDLGKTFQGKKLDHVFHFKNVGTSNLHIIKVKAG